MTEQASGRRRAGFRQTGSLLTRQMRAVSEKRGFVETRLLTDWAHVVGAEIAAHATPVRVAYSRGRMGATLVVRCEGARAPEIEMSRETIRARVNACYGYNAITRVQITQTAPSAPAGLAEPAAPFEPKRPEPAPKTRAAAAAAVAPIADPDLRDALTRLGANVLARAPGDPRRKE